MFSNAQQTVKNSKFPALSELVKPAKLNSGDLIATISLSCGAAGDMPRRYQVGVRQLEQTFPLKVVPTRNALQPDEWIYQNPKARAADLMEAFSNPEIKAIFSTIGGDDSIRLLNLVDLDVIKKNPKIFMGFSDTTVTHFMCLKAGLSSIYGPSIMTTFAENCGIHPYSAAALQQVLFKAEANYELPTNKNGWTVEHLDWMDPKNENIPRKLKKSAGPNFINGNEVVTGRLLGGCLDVLQFINGTTLWPDLPLWKDSILFIETAEDAMSPAQVGWFLRNLGAQGILSEISGLLYSKPGGHLLDPKTFPEYDREILKILAEYDRLDLPVVTNLDFGHTEPFFPLAYGQKIRIDPQAKKLTFLEPAVV